MRSSKARSAADSGLTSPALTSFQSICSSVRFIWAQFIFKRATTIAGSYQSGAIVNGTGISNLFDFPHGIALDKLGNIYVADDAANVVRKGWTSGSPAACVLNPPQISAWQVQLGVLVQTGTPTNFTLLQADQLNGSWSTNSSWLLTTNIPGLNYGMTTRRFNISNWRSISSFS